MAYGVTNSKHYQDISVSIRNKTGSSDTYKPGEMSTAISNISSGGRYDYCQYAKSFSFQGNTEITEIEFGDLPNVTSLSSAFYGCSKLDSVVIGDMDSVTNTYCMFHQCYNLTNLDIGDLPNVTNTYCMFHQCYNLPSVILGDLSNVTDIRYLFNYCYSLVDIVIGDFSNVTQSYNMFYRCSALENLTINGNTCAVSFDLHWSTKLTHTSLLNVLNALPTVETTQTLTLGSTNKAKLTDEEIQIAVDRGWSVV